MRTVVAILSGGHDVLSRTSLHRELPGFDSVRFSREPLRSTLNHGLRRHDQANVGFTPSLPEFETVCLARCDGDARRRIGPPARAVSALRQAERIVPVLDLSSGSTPMFDLLILVEQIRRANPHAEIARKTTMMAAHGFRRTGDDAEWAKLDYPLFRRYGHFKWAEHYAGYVFLAAAGDAVPPYDGFAQQFSLGIFEVQMLFWLFRTGSTAREAGSRLTPGQAEFGVHFSGLLAERWQQFLVRAETSGWLEPVPLDPAPSRPVLRLSPKGKSVVSALSPALVDFGLPTRLSLWLQMDYPTARDHIDAYAKLFHERQRGYLERRRIDTVTWRPRR